MKGNANNLIQEVNWLPISHHNHCTKSASKIMHISNQELITNIFPARIQATYL